jgi:hypothetical protein
MILAAACLDDVNGGVDDWGEGCRPGETDVRDNGAVAGERVLEADAGAVVGVEAEHGLVVGGGVAEAEAGDVVVVVEGRQRSPEDAERLLVRVGLCSDGVQAPAAVRALPRPLVAFGEINADDEIRRLQAGSLQSALHFLHRRVVVAVPRERPRARVAARRCCSGGRRWRRRLRIAHALGPVLATERKRNSKNQPAGAPAHERAGASWVWTEEGVGMRQFAIAWKMKATAPVFFFSSKSVNIHPKKSNTIPRFYSN